LRAWLLIALAAGCLTGCGDDDDDPDDAGSSGAAGAGPDDCPDPDHPAVHYRTRDVNECPIEELVCESDQYGFHNACGCGCIDQGGLPCDLDPNSVTFISQDPAECGDLAPTCPLGETPFNNSCGCGCIVPG
jgi:hypothetical protein